MLQGPSRLLMEKGAPSYMRRMIGGGRSPVCDAVHIRAVLFGGLASQPSAPRRHRRVLTDRHPGPPAPPAEQGVELGAARGDGAAVWQRHGAARGVDGLD